jgi:hypothetical protein
MERAGKAEQERAGRVVLEVESADTAGDRASETAVRISPHADALRDVGVGSASLCGRVWPSPRPPLRMRLDRFLQTDAIARAELSHRLPTTFFRPPA